ncbi:MAG TPA: DUF3943 domain-containing protein [Gemmatimonadales bacterium]|nr:DUF3943 domain-containing protein [Gemmatimonadales bacterium]
MPSPTLRGPKCGRARTRHVLLGLLLAAGVPGVRVAQAQAGHGDGVELVAVDPDSGTAAARDAAEAQRRWGGALFDWSFANVFPWAYNRYVSDQDWARVSPASWSRNLQAELTWDDNSLYANHLAHAYHGAMYHNAGRANGFTFWGSVPFSVTGSLVWEYFAEVNPPSANDLITTTAGGVVLGEVAWRAAQLVIDDGATGLDRVWREVAVFAMNPGLGAHRVTRGKAWRVTRGAGPARAPHESSFDVGYRSVGYGTSTSGGLQQALVRGTLRHGDPHAQEQLRPFDVFDVSFELGSNQPRLLMSVEGSGILAGGRVARGMVLGATMEYGLIGNSVYEFSAGSLGLSLRGRTPGSGRWRAGADLELLATPVAAVPTDYSRDWIERPYDLSAGVGARARAYVDRGPVQARLSYTAHYLVPLSAAATQHHVQLASVEAKVPLVGPFSVGAGYDIFIQSSRFGQDVGRVTRQYPDLRFFISKAGGDWR